MIGDERLNDSTRTETQYWKRTNLPPAATACWRSATLMPWVPEIERRSRDGARVRGEVGIGGGCEGIRGGSSGFIIDGDRSSVARLWKEESRKIFCIAAAPPFLSLRPALVLLSESSSISAS